MISWTQLLCDEKMDSSWVSPVKAVDSEPHVEADPVDIFTDRSAYGIFFDVEGFIPVGVPHEISP